MEWEKRDRRLLLYLSDGFDVLGVAGNEAWCVCVLVVLVGGHFCGLDWFF